jgi:hypothetical protein
MVLKTGKTYTKKLRDTEKISRKFIASNKSYQNARSVLLIEHFENLKDPKTRILCQYLSHYTLGLVEFSLERSLMSRINLAFSFNKLVAK